MRADEITIDHVETADGTRLDGAVRRRPPARRASTRPTSSVEVDGRTVDADGQDRRPPATSHGPRCSCSTPATAWQADGKFDAATAAVDAFLDAAPADVAIGLVTFAGDVVGVDRADHRPRGGRRCPRRGRPSTQGHQRLRRHPRRRRPRRRRRARAPSSSSPTAPTPAATRRSTVAINDAKDAGVVVDVVSLASTGRQAAELSRIAEDTGGSVIPADPAALGSVFTAAGRRTGQQLLVTFDSPADVDGEAIDRRRAEAAGDGRTTTRRSSPCRRVARLPGVVEAGKARSASR